jgi:hypothetical protein
LFIFPLLPSSLPLFSQYLLLTSQYMRTAFTEADRTLKIE